MYGIAFELHTVLQHQWKYDVNWLTKLKDFDLLTHNKKRQLCESALHSLGYDPMKIPCKTDQEYGHAQLDTSGEAGAEDYDAQISALMEGRTPPSFGPSSSGATTSGLSGGYATHSAAAVPTAKAMPKSSTSTTRPCPTSQGGQANKIRKIQDVMKTSFPLTPTPSTNRYREMPPISQQACKKACEAIDHGMGQGYSLEDWYTWHLSEELTSDVMDNLTFAWFPDHDIIRLVPELTDFPFSPESAIVKDATPEMALNPLYDPDAIPSDQPPCPSSDQSDPWYVPKSMNFPKHLVVRKGIVFGYHSITPNEAWNFMAIGNTRLEPVNSYFGNQGPLIRMPAFWSECMTQEQFHTGICGLTAKKISLDGRTVTIFHGNNLLGHTLSIATPHLLDLLDSKSSCTMSLGDSSICWPRQTITATFSSGMISITVGVFHLHFFQLQMLVHPSSSAALGVSLNKDGKPAQPRLILI